jgi:hypothetical protein
MGGFSFSLGPVSFGRSDDQAAIDAQTRMAAEDRRMRAEQWQSEFDLTKALNWWTQRWAGIQRDDQLNKLTLMAKDARRAGISPLAALGSQGVQPINASLRGGPGPMAAGALPSAAQGRIIEASADAEVLKKLFEAKKLQAEANSIADKTPEGQVPATEYGPLRREEVPVSSSHVKPGLESSLSYQRGPGGTRIPVANADIEEIIAGFLIEKFGHYQVMQNMGPEQDHSWMFPHTGAYRRRKSRKWRRDNPRR